jgi:hypothetical protein
MRPELPAILRAYAADLAVCGAREVAIADLLREAADALLTAPLTFDQRRMSFSIDARGVDADRVITHTSLIAGHCPACEDE